MTAVNYVDPPIVDDDTCTCMHVCMERRYLYTSYSLHKHHLNGMCTEIYRCVVLLTY